MKLLRFLLLFCALPSLHAQDFSREFGIISKAEIELQVYEKDPDAKAVILFDLGESRFIDMGDGGYEISFTRTKRIKIFDQAASEYAEISIPFYVDGYGKTEVVKSIQASTYNLEDGRLEKKALNPETIFEEKVTENVRVKKFVFPDVQDGSIIEYQYVFQTPFHFNLPDWTFQDRIPTVYSQYTTRMIPFYEYVFILKGVTGFDYEHAELSKNKRSWGKAVSVAHGGGSRNLIEFQDYVFTYGMKNVPAFKDESYITSINDYLISMNFQLAKFYNPTGGVKEVISTWPKLNETFLKQEHFGKYLSKCSPIARKIVEKELNLIGKSEAEKGKILVTYVKANFSWDGSLGKLTSKTPKEFVTQRTGNVAEINLFLLALLEAADLEAYPLLSSTRSHGKVSTEYPFEHFFNYVTVFVNGEKPFLADGTDRFLPYNRIPPRCMNEKGLVVQKEEVLWLRMDNAMLSMENKQINIVLPETGTTAKAKLIVQSTGYKAYYHRRRHQNDTTSIKQFYHESSLENIHSVQTASYEHTARPYVMVLEGELEVERFGENLVLAPFSSLAMSQNELTQQTRSYPVDFVYPEAEQFQITITIPPGFAPVDVPEPININNELVEISLTYEVGEEIMLISGKYDFKEAIYFPSEYSQIKSYLDIIVEQFNQQVVFEKQ